MTNYNKEFKVKNGLIATTATVSKIIFSDATEMITASAAGSQGPIGYTGSKGDSGLGFSIAKTYTSVAALTADTSPTGIVAGQFAIIENGNVQDPENSRLYLWNAGVYTYTSDLSGAQGITGATGYTGSQGASGYTGSAGTNGTNGTTGYTGSQGIQGTTGAIGYTGSQGIQGTTGAIGYTGSGGMTSVYTRDTLPTGSVGLVITISDSGSDDYSPAGNYALAYWNTVEWLYVANSNSISPTTPSLTWTPILVTMTQGTGANIDTFTSTGTGSWGSGSVRSTEGYATSTVTFRALQTNKGFMMGLTTTPATNDSWNNLQNRWYLSATGVANIWDTNNAYQVSYGSYTTSTIFAVEYNGTNIKYYKDGVVVRTIAPDVAGTHWLDSSCDVTGVGIEVISYL